MVLAATPYGLTLSTPVYDDRRAEGASADDQSIARVDVLEKLQRCYRRDTQTTTPRRRCL